MVGPIIYRRGAKSPPFVVDVNERRYAPWPLFSVSIAGREIGRLLSYPSWSDCQDMLSRSRRTTA